MPNTVSSISDIVFHATSRSCTISSLQKSAIVARVSLGFRRLLALCSLVITLQCDSLGNAWSRVVYGTRRRQENGVTAKLCRSPGRRDQDKQGPRHSSARGSNWIFDGAALDQPDPLISILPCCGVESGSNVNTRPGRISSIFRY